MKVSKPYGVAPKSLSERNNLKEGGALLQGRVLHIPQEL